jgi:hypothetical protein
LATQDAGGPLTLLSVLLSLTQQHTSPEQTPYPVHALEGSTDELIVPLRQDLACKIGTADDQRSKWTQSDPREVTAFLGDASQQLEPVRAKIAELPQESGPLQFRNVHVSSSPMQVLISDEVALPRSG